MGISGFPRCETGGNVLGMSTRMDTRHGTAGRVYAYEVEIGDRVVWGKRPVTITDKIEHNRGCTIQLRTDQGDDHTFGRAARVMRLAPARHNAAA